MTTVAQTDRFFKYITTTKRNDNVCHSLCRGRCVESNVNLYVHVVLI